MTYTIGKIALTPKGTYSSSTTYQPLDFVLYNGSSYVCKSANTRAKTPTNTTYWQLLAQAGQAVLTPQQEAEIIQALVDGGVIIDPNYNTYTTAEKNKLAGLSNPNNGTLAINYDGRQIGTFTANQSTNSTINVPTPGNGVIKLVREDNQEEIGHFSVNQKEDEIIRIPVGSGGGGSANDGTLTIKQGSTTLGTFTANQSTNSTVTVANNSLTIQRNGTTLNTYNPAAAKTINITVPTSVSDLADGGSYPTYRGYTSNRNNTTSDTLDGACEIVKLNSNYVYYCTSATSLKVSNYTYDTSDEMRNLTEPVTYIYIDAADTFTINVGDLPVAKKMNNLTINQGRTYLVTVVGCLWRIDEIS